MFRHPDRYEAKIPAQKAHEFRPTFGDVTLTYDAVSSPMSQPLRPMTQQTQQNRSENSPKKQLELPTVKTYGRTFLPGLNQQKNTKPINTNQQRRPATAEFRSTTVASHNANFTQLLPNGIVYREFSKSEPRERLPSFARTVPTKGRSTVAPYTGTLSHNVPEVAAMNSTIGHLPGYGGHVNGIQYSFGRSFGPVTAELVAEETSRRSNQFNDGF